MNCEHKNFRAAVKVNRLENTRQFNADVLVQCADCGEPFHFLGLPVGLNLHGAACSPDGTEARLAIAPGPRPVASTGKAVIRT